LRTQSHKSCDCLFNTVGFLSELRHYALNVHVVLSLIAILGGVQMVIVSPYPSKTSTTLCLAYRIRFGNLSGKPYRNFDQKKTGKGSSTGHSPRRSRCTALQTSFWLLLGSVLEIELLEHTLKCIVYVCPPQPRMLLFSPN
jgi:hypothetical protein